MNRRILVRGAIERGPPDEKMFYQIFMQMCQTLKVPFDRNGFLHLLQKWYREAKRPLQAVHPRDILKTLIAICDYADLIPLMTPELLDSHVFPLSEVENSCPASPAIHPSWSSEKVIEYNGTERLS